MHEPLTVEGLRREVFDVARQVAKDFPDASDSLALMGKLHHQFGDRTEAAECWQKCVERNPRRADAYYGMAVLALENGRCERAVKLCRQARQIAPRLPGVHRRLGEALLELGKPEEAVEALQAEIENHPDDAEAHGILGQAHLQLQQYDQAVAAYEKSLDMLPDDSRACYGLAVAHARLGQTDKGDEYRERFRELRAAEDKSIRNKRKTASDLVWMAQIAARTHTDVSHVYFGHRRLGEVERHLKRAATLDPKNVVCRQRLVELYMRLGRRAEAVDVCQQLRQMDPDNATYHLNTGALLAELRQYDAAEQALRQGIELAPERPTGYRALVQVLMFGKEQPSEAKALAEKLVQVEPMATNYFLLSQACELSEDFAGALAAIQRAAELAPRSDRIRRAHSRLQQRASREQPQPKE